MEFNKNKPIYLQIIFEIKRRISLGLLKAGDKLPSIRELAEELQVNPNTIVRTYQEMEREGLAESKRGLGTFIVDSKEVSRQTMRATLGQSLVQEFIENMLQNGISKTEILELVKNTLLQES